MMTSRFITRILPVILSLTLQPALAQTAPATDDGAEQRINLSGKLRMLSQRVPSAACHLNQGIDVEGARALLVAASTEFEDILAALENGNASLGIAQPETRRMTLGQIATVREIWEPIKQAAAAAASGSATDEDMDLLFNENMVLLASAQRLVEELVKQYANPMAATRASLMLVDISGRQRMLTQKMSKEACIIGSDFQTASTHSDLDSTVQIFEASLDALRFGMPQLGVLPPPNPDIATGLDGVLRDWQSVSPLIAQVSADQELADDDQTKKFQQLNVTMASMNAVVGMYASASK